MQCDKTLTSKPGRRRLRRHLAQAALVSVFVAGQLLGTLHFVLVEHVICLEHGEMTHAAKVAEPTDWIPSSPLGEIARFESGRPGAYWAVDDHAHCLVQALRRETATRTRVSTPATTEGRCALDHPLTASHPSEESALFMLAPKHSPPL